MKSLAVLLLLPLAACASMTVDDFAGGRPAMDLSDYFSGKSTAYGLFLNRFGDVKRQFTVAMDGHWDGRALKLDEDFTFSDGQTQQRHWTFVRNADATWTGTAPDVIGEAHGRMAGNAFNMQYTVDLATDGGTHRVDFDDWLFRESPDVVLNRATVTKFGVMVGQVQLAFVRGR